MCSYSFVSHRYGTEQATGLDEVPLMMSDDSFETDEQEYLMRPQGTSGSQGRGIGWYLTEGWKVACSK